MASISMPLESLTSTVDSKAKEVCIDDLNGEATPTESCDQSELLNEDNNHQITDDLSFSKRPTKFSNSENGLQSEMVCNNKEIELNNENDKCDVVVAEDRKPNPDIDLVADDSENIEFCQPSIDKVSEPKCAKSDANTSDVPESGAVATLNPAELSVDPIETEDCAIEKTICPETCASSKTAVQIDKNSNNKNPELAENLPIAGSTERDLYLDSTNENATNKSGTAEQQLTEQFCSQLSPEALNNQDEVNEKSNSRSDSKIMQNCLSDPYSDISSGSSKLSCTVKSFIENDEEEEANSDAKIEALIPSYSSKKSRKKEKLSDSEMEDGEIASSSDEENLITSQPELFFKDRFEYDNVLDVKNSRKRSLIDISAESGEERETANMGFEGELPTYVESKKQKLAPIVYNSAHSGNLYGANGDKFYPDGQGGYNDWDFTNEDSLLKVQKQCLGEISDGHASSSTEYDDLRDMLKRRKKAKNSSYVIDPQMKRKFTFPKGKLKDSPSDSEDEMDGKKFSTKEKKRKEKLKEGSKEIEEKVSKKSTKDKKKRRSDRTSESFDSDSNPEDVKSATKKKSKKLEKQIKKKMKKLRKLEKEQSDDNTTLVKQSLDDKTLVKKQISLNLYEEAKKTKTNDYSQKKVEHNSRDSTKRAASSNSNKPKSKESSSSPTAEYFVQNGWANLDNLMQQFVDFQFKNLAQSMQNNQTMVETTIATCNVEGGGAKSEMSISPVGQVQSPVIAGPDSLNTCAVSQNHVIDQIFSSSTYQNSSHCNQYQFEHNSYRYMAPKWQFPENDQDSLLVEPDKPRNEQMRTGNGARYNDSLLNFGTGKFINNQNLTVLTKVEGDLEEGEFDDCNENSQDDSFDVEKELDLFLETARNEAKLDDAEKSVDDFIREQRKISADQKQNSTSTGIDEHCKQLNLSPKKDLDGAISRQSLPEIKEEPQYFATEPPPQPQPFYMDKSNNGMEPRLSQSSSNIAITLEMPEFISPSLHTPKSEDEVFSREVRSNDPMPPQWVQEPVGVFSEEEARSFRGSLNDTESCSESINEEPPSTIPQVEANYKIAKACLKPQSQFQNQDSNSGQCFESLIQSPQKEMEFANVGCTVSQLQRDQVTSLGNTDVNNINTSEIEIPENIRSLFAGELESENRNISSVDILSSLKSNLAKPNDEQNDHESPENSNDISTDTSKEQHRGTYEPFFKNPRIKKFADEQISLSGLPDPRLLAMNRKLRASNFRKDMKRVKRWNADIEIERVRRPLKKIKPIKLLDGDVDESQEQKRPSQSRSEYLRQSSSNSYQDTSVHNYQDQSFNYRQSEEHPVYQQQSNFQEQRVPLPPLPKTAHRRSPGACSGTYDTRYVPLDWIDPDEPAFDPRTNSALVCMRFLVTDFWATQFVIDDFWVHNDNDDEDNSLLVQPDLSVRPFPNPSIRNSLFPERQPSNVFRPEFSPTQAPSQSAPPNFSTFSNVPEPTLDPRLVSARVIPNQPNRIPTDSSNVSYDTAMHVMGAPAMTGSEGHKRPEDTDYRQINKQAPAAVPSSLTSVPRFPTPRHIPASPSTILPPPHVPGPINPDMLMGTPLIMPNQDVDLRTIHQQQNLPVEHPDVLPLNHFPSFPPPVPPHFSLQSQEPLLPSFSHAPQEPPSASESARLTLTASSSRSHFTSNLQPTTRKLSSYNPKPRENPPSLPANESSTFASADQCFGDIDMRQNKPAPVVSVAQSTELVSSATTVTAKKNPLAPKFDSLSPTVEQPSSITDVSENCTADGDNLKAVEKAPPEPKKPKKNPLMPVFS